MIDKTYNAERYIAQYEKTGEELIDRIELKDFDLSKFQKQLGVQNENDPMFDCFPIKENDFDFLIKYISENIILDFDNYEYFLEAEQINEL
jgi:hypothetical protein